MACIKVLVTSGNISLRNLATVACLKLFWPLHLCWEKFIAICHVYDMILWVRNKKDIVELAIQLNAEGFDLEQEVDADWFLGVHIEHNPNTGFLNMMKEGLIKQVLKTLGLDVRTANGKLTPHKGKTLTKHVHGEPASGDFNYSMWLECFCILLDTHTP